MTIGITDTRQPTGIPGFDDILCGGLPTARSYLLAGSPGAGKTIFSLQWLRAGAARGERGMYISLCEPVAQLAGGIAGFGWDLADLDVIDLSPAGTTLEDNCGDYRIFPPSEVESVPAWKAIYDAVRTKRPRRVVIDSVTQLLHLATDQYQFRKSMLALVNFLNQQQATTFMAFEPTELDRDASAALAVDGIFRLRSEISSTLAIGMRSIQVDKLRGSDFLSGWHPLRIGADGVRIFPHRIEHTGMLQPGEKIVSSGIPELDALLGGGIESGTTTLLTGPTGAGKSTLGIQFAALHAEYSRSIVFTFEEPASFIVARSRGIGAPIDRMLESGALRIVRVNPLELYPDEFLGMVRHEVEVDGRRMVMIDSLRGYQFAMEEFGRPQAHIHNLVNYLSRQGVTTLLINEVEHITSTSLKATDLGVSHLADNIVLLRYAEFAGKFIKIVGCLKKRVGNFEPELRRMDVSAQGIRVSEKLQHLRGIVTGVPEFTSADEAT